MAPSSEATAEQRALVLEIDRMFEAPRELVFRMFRDVEHIVRWYGPEGYALLECDNDFRVGGKWRRCMSNGPGHAHWISGEYLEVDEPRRLQFTYVNAYDGFETVVTIDFQDVGGKTRMLFRQTLFISQAERDGHGWGWNSTFDLLDQYVSQFNDADWRPKGRPRSDGAAEDIVTARRRRQEEN